MSYLIECKNLTAGYEGMPVVKDLSFNVSAGDYLCIVGENGSGKSTLAKLIAGIYRPTSGQIILDGEGASGRVLGILQGILRHLGLPGAADRLTMHIVRKLAHFCEYLLEGFLLMLCLRVYTRHFFKHVSWPMLGGLLTALTDETIQLFVPGRSGQVTDIWIDFSGVMTGLLVGLILLGLVRMCIILYQHRNEV